MSLLIPAHSTILPRDVSLTTRLTRTISLNFPLLSAAMDTVTESRLAIAIAQEGGMGIIHKNMTPALQAARGRRVKRFESGVVKDPITVTPNMKVRDVLNDHESTQDFGLAGRRCGASVVGHRDATAIFASKPISISRSRTS